MKINIIRMDVTRCDEYIDVKMSTSFMNRIKLVVNILARGKMRIIKDNRQSLYNILNKLPDTKKDE